MFDSPQHNFYAMNTYQIKPLNSYAEALAHFNNVLPIRGLTVKPLGKRRYHSGANISVDDGENVCLNYCGHPLVAWHKDNSFTVDAPVHYSAFTVHTLHYYLPKTMRFGWDKGRLIVVLEDQTRYVLLRGKNLHFITDGDGFKVSSDIKEYNYRKRPRMATKIMAKYQPFIDWVGLVTSIDNKQGEFEEETTAAHDKLRIACGLPPDKVVELAYARHYSKMGYENLLRVDFSKYMACAYNIPIPRERKDWSHTQSAKAVLDWMEGSEPNDNWVSAMYVILRQGGTRDYDYKNRTGWCLRFEKDNLTKYIEELISVVYRDTVFIKEELEAGKVPSKTNHCYFNDVALEKLTDMVSDSSV
jgi:hypothetical protein